MSQIAELRGIKLLGADEENVLRGTGSLIAQILVETGSTVTGEDRSAGVVLLRGEQVARSGV
jgi:hypothetical protein